MSDLEADLYGDLYGNDESEFTADQAEDPVKLEESPTTKLESSPPPPKAASSSSTAPLTTTTTSNAQSYAVPISSSSDQTDGHTSPTTQQIPTYQERQDQDYSQASMPHVDGGYANQQDRPVRPSEMKEEGKMFIGGLNWDTTDESLRKYFTQFGKVEACTIMRDAAGRSRCFAFLTFEDPASVNAVMVREHFLDGKIIDPKRAIPRQEHQRATKLFIGGLPGSVTSESMREFFSQFGKVVDSTVMLDRETGRSKGFGFVSFEGADVGPILGFGNLELDGKLIDVKLAQPRSQREGFTDGQPSGPTTTTASASAAGGRNFSNQSFGNQGNFNNAGGSGPAPAATGTTAPGGAPFDPQALASLYTRMFQQMGAMNPMMGGMNMMGGMGGNPAAYGGVRMPAMGGNMMGGMNMGMGGGMGQGTPNMAMNRGPGMQGGQGGMMGGNMNANIPRGPRGGSGGPGGGGAPGVGPQRAAQRGQHNYHPYARS